MEWHWNSIERQAKLNFDVAGGDEAPISQKLIAVAGLWADAMNTSAEDGPLRFAVLMAEFELWIYSLNRSMNETQDQTILNFKCGVPPRKFMDVFNEIAVVFGDNIRVDRPFTADDLRPRLEVIGIPHKPYHTIAILDETRDLFNKPAEPEEQGVSLRDIFVALEFSEEDISKAVKKFVDSKKIKTPAIGETGGKNLYRLSEILRDFGNYSPLTPAEKTRLSKRLQPMVRKPEEPKRK